MKKSLIGLGLILIIIIGLVFYSNSEKTFSSEGESEVFVYETEVDGPDDCSSYEQYDEENQLCVFECETEAQCKEIENEIDRELSSWTEELEKDTEPVAEKKVSANTEADATYKVNSGESISLVSGDDAAEYRKIWQDIAALSPDSLSNTYIETYEIFNSPSDDTLAFVDDEDGNGKWRVAVNLAGHKSSNEREQKATFIHELGHIITLNSSQVNPNIDKENCNNFHIDEGCANSNSFVNSFKNTFWKGLSEQIFAEDRFVTEYASTNEVEDMAESFAFFVLSSRDTSGLEKGEKINFFYSYPELVNVRDTMRNSLSKDIVRARKVN